MPKMIIISSHICHKNFLTPKTSAAHGFRLPGMFLWLPQTVCFGNCGCYTNWRAFVTSGQQCQSTVQQVFLMLKLH